MGVWLGLLLPNCVPDNKLLRLEFPSCEPSSTDMRGNCGGTPGAFVVPATVPGGGEARLSDCVRRRKKPLPPGLDDPEDGRCGSMVDILGYKEEECCATSPVGNGRVHERPESCCCLTRGFATRVD